MSENSFHSLSLSGKTALVCGASSGIGRATALLFAERGARVIALARREEKLKELMRDLPGQGHEFIVFDLGDIEKNKAALVQRLKKEKIHIVVNNAGGPAGGPLYQADEKSFEAPMQAHLMAAHILMQTVLPGMQEAQYGRILNIISTSVKTPLPNLGVSNTVRGAMASWAKTLAGELASFGITVNNVLPGFIGTERYESLKENSAKAQNIDQSVVETSWLKSVPAGRVGEAREVAEALAFLASPAASYVTGINLPVDGGRTPSL